MSTRQGTGGLKLGSGSDHSCTGTALDASCETVAEVQPKRKKLAENSLYIGIGIAVVLMVPTWFLPDTYRWFLIGVVVGFFIALAVIFGDLFWKSPQNRQ
jgi:hypothetical protein